MSTLGIKYKPIMTKEGSAKIVNFIIIGAGSLVVGRGYTSHNYSALKCIIFYIVNIHHIDCYCFKGI